MVEQEKVLPSPRTLFGRCWGGHRQYELTDVTDADIVNTNWRTLLRRTSSIRIDGRYWGGQRQYELMDVVEADSVNTNWRTLLADSDRKNWRTLLKRTASIRTDGRYWRTATGRSYWRTATGRTEGRYWGGQSIRTDGRYWGGQRQEVLADVTEADRVNKNWRTLLDSVNKNWRTLLRRTAAGRTDKLNQVVSPGPKADQPVGPCKV